jgi:hypothetical protein
MQYARNLNTIKVTQHLYSLNYNNNPIRFDSQFGIIFGCCLKTCFQTLNFITYIKLILFDNQTYTVQFTITTPALHNLKLRSFCFNTRLRNSYLRLQDLFTGTYNAINEHTVVSLSIYETNN